MARYVKILVFDTEGQARLLDSVLTEHGVPHMMCSYHDSAYDGIFQLSKGWGHVEAPESYREEVLDLFAKLPQLFMDVDDDAGHEDAEEDLS